MENQETKNEKSRVKLKWYWWVLIFIVVVNVISAIFSDKEVDKKDNPQIVASDSSAKVVELPKKSKKEVDKILSGLKVSGDEFQKMRFYRDPTSAKYDNVNAVYLYLGRNEDDYVYPRMCLQYAGEDWIFINIYKFVIDGQTRNIYPEDIKTDNNGDGVWEVTDKSPSSFDLMILSEIANSKVSKIRYEGKEKVYDRTISDKEKKALKNVLNIYEKLK